MDNKNLFQKAKDLNLPIGKYALFGSTPMGIRGLKECEDIDIIVSEDLWSLYKSNPDWKFGKTENGSEFLANGDVEFWHTWTPWYPNVDGLIAEAEIIDGLPFVRLEEVLSWKKAYAREKDFKDVEIIEKYLADLK